MRKGDKIFKTARPNNRDFGKLCIFMAQYDGKDVNFLLTTNFLKIIPFEAFLCNHISLYGV